MISPYHIEVNHDEDLATEKAEHVDNYIYENFPDRWNELDTYLLDEALDLGEETNLAKLIVHELKFEKEFSSELVYAGIKVAVARYIKDQLQEEGELQYDSMRPGASR